MEDSATTLDVAMLISTSKLASHDGVCKTGQDFLDKSLQFPTGDCTFSSSSKLLAGETHSPKQQASC